MICYSSPSLSLFFLISYIGSFGGAQIVMFPVCALQPQEEQHNAPAIAMPQKLQSILASIELERQESVCGK